MQRYIVSLALVSAASAPLVSCDSDRSDPVTYHTATKAILDARCVSCHRAGDIGPFPLTTYEEVQRFAGAIQTSVESGRMPPWQPSDDCNTYAGNSDLTASEKKTLLDWIDAGAPEGDPAEAPAQPAPTEAASEFEADMFVQLPEPYEPAREPDDYRCQIIDWPALETRFVTGVRVTPDQRAIVHHVILYVAGPEEVAQYRAFDAAEDGPGYTCYGGPRASNAGGLLGSVEPTQVLAALTRLGLSPDDLRAGTLTPEQTAALMGELGVDPGNGFRSIGSWVPGTPNALFPAGTGIRVEPGSAIVAQFHYNTRSSAPTPDQSTIEIATVSSVEREATMLRALNLGWLSNGAIGGEAMTIPAGVPSVEHSTTLTYDSLFMLLARRSLGLADDAPLVLHTANHHMHELGVSQRSELRHADGTSSCVLDIPDWDFAWQGSYTLANPMKIRPGDSLWVGCRWDNSAAHQPIIDGVVREPVDIAWGEGTDDEMCLAAYYVTGE